MIRVQIEYFAILREHVGRDGEEIRTGAGSAADLFDELARRYAFPKMSHMKIAINDEFADWDAVLADGDSIAFIPPVAGG